MRAGSGGAGVSRRSGGAGKVGRGCLAAPGQPDQPRAQVILQAIEFKGGFVIDSHQLGEFARIKRGGERLGYHLGVGEETGFIGIEITREEVGELGEGGRPGALKGGRGGGQARASVALRGLPLPALMLAVACFHEAPIFEIWAATSSSLAVSPMVASVRSRRQ